MNDELVVQEINKPTALIELALKSSADITTIEKLVDMQNKFEEKEARKEFFKSLAKFQSEMPVICKNGEVNFNSTNYTFAKLEDIGKAIRNTLFNNGMSYRFEQQMENNIITVDCIITHEMGHSEKTTMSSAGDNSGKKNAIQQIGSAVSYLKRYTLIGALGLIISEEDDDGNSIPKPEGVDYPNESFNLNFPKWKEKIISGEFTNDSLLSFLESRGIVLQDWQIEQVEKVKLEK